MEGVDFLQLRTAEIDVKMGVGETYLTAHPKTSCQISGCYRSEPIITVILRETVGIDIDTSLNLTTALDFVLVGILILVNRDLSKSY